MQYLNLDILTVPQLRDELRAQGVKTTGIKADLVMRLRRIPDPPLTGPVQEMQYYFQNPQAEEENYWNNQ